MIRNRGFGNIFSVCSFFSHLTFSIARLADLSLLHGDLRLAELCLQRARSYARLSFLYTLTGQADKLGKLVRRWMVFNYGDN